MVSQLTPGHEGFRGIIPGTKTSESSTLAGTSTPVTVASSSASMPSPNNTRGKNKKNKKDSRNRKITTASPSARSPRRRGERRGRRLSCLSDARMEGVEQVFGFNSRVTIKRHVFEKTFINMKNGREHQERVGACIAKFGNGVRLAIQHQQSKKYLYASKLFFTDQKGVFLKIQQPLFGRGKAYVRLRYYDPATGDARTSCIGYFTQHRWWKITSIAHFIKDDQGRRLYTIHRKRGFSTVKIRDPQSKTSLILGNKVRRESKWNIMFPPQASALAKALLFCGFLLVSELD
eukprot:gb/GECH01009700.1/.p1 GENE.gb/GECH01009700.1/~~gb/GECH01009700.1/.p1  ORF type:complete len:290 (+),score=53.57 gb/GECH01009700.1/:1-870(+)